MYTCNDPNAPLGQAMTSVPGFDTTRLAVGYLPGIIIFVHGVNSDGEWYSAAEKGLLQGLNTRMGLDQSAAPDAKFTEVKYAKEIFSDGKTNKSIDGLNFITDFGRSPVIRFRWGYKAAGEDQTPGSKDEVKEYGGKIYLNELDAWGGGPFQNGTSALPYMWGAGQDDRVFWWLYANMFPIDGREIYAAPPRSYFAHAAHRLKELIKAIREKQADCPITVVCHSQGNMVTMGAALLGEKDGAVADTYVLCNPPYSLETVTMDTIVNDESKSATGQFGAVTTLARKETFRNFLTQVKKRANQGQPLGAINLRIGSVRIETHEPIFELGAFPADPKEILPEGVDRDNRGRVFLYCNPHDQVIGVSPVQGIGWRGVSQAQLAEVGGEGVFHQRVWAMASERQSPPFAVGAPAWTGRAYRYLDDHHLDADNFWYPASTKARFKLSLNDSQGWVSKVLTVGFAPFFWLGTQVYGLSVNADPPKDWAVPINAPMLRQSHTPQAVRYDVPTTFDQGDDPGPDALAKDIDEGKLRDGRYGGAFDTAGKGNAVTEAEYRREIEARLERARKAAANAKPPRSLPTEEDEREAVKRMMEENPNATDHSTILTSSANAEKVLAYDVGIGWVDPCKITAKDMLAFRQFAHWMMLEAATESMPIAKKFTEYWEQGWYEQKQLQHTYTMNHMAENAPGIQDDDRERNFVGRIKG